MVSGREEVGVLWCSAPEKRRRNRCAGFCCGAVIEQRPRFLLCWTRAIACGRSLSVVIRGYRPCGGGKLVDAKAKPWHDGLRERAVAISWVGW